MTPRQAALDFAASLLLQQLARAHSERRDGQIMPSLVLDTFELAPPNVRAALEKGQLDAAAVAEEMDVLVEELQERRRNLDPSRVCSRCGASFDDHRAGTLRCPIPTKPIYEQRFSKTETFLPKLGTVAE